MKANITKIMFHSKLTPSLNNVSFMLFRPAEMMTRQHVNRSSSKQIYEQEVGKLSIKLFQNRCSSGVALNQKQ